MAASLALGLASVMVAAAPAVAAGDCPVPGAPVVEAFSMTPATVTAPSGDDVEQTALTAQVDACGAEQVAVRVDVTAPDGQTRALDGFAPRGDSAGAFAADLTWRAGDVGRWTFALVAETVDAGGVAQRASAEVPFTVVAPTPPPPVVTAPGQPTGLRVTARSAASGTVAWEPPVADGGSTVTGYRVVGPGADVTLGAAARSFTLTGLAPARSYAVSVQAENAQGYGPVSTTTLTTLATAPSRPAAVSVSQLTTTSGRVSWKAPTSDGGSAVTGYRVVKPGADVTVAASVRSYVVKGLKPGQSYPVTIAAKNALGQGPGASVALTTLATPPSRPTSVGVSQRTATSGRVSWKTPTSDGGAAITAYRVVKPGADVTVAATARSYVVKGLAPGRAHTVTIVAKNAAGYGPGSTVTLKTLTTVPSKPRALAVSKRTTSSAKISWQAPASNGGSTITGYRIVKPGADVTVKASARSYTVKGLKPGRSYTVKTTAKNGRGYGPSAAVTFTTKAAGGGAGCTPGYSPCLPPASDYDCAGGSGNGPKYVVGPVYVTGSDPYDLDRDGDGVACEP